MKRSPILLKHVSYKQISPNLFFSSPTFLCPWCLVVLFRDAEMDTCSMQPPMGPQIRNNRSTLNCIDIKTHASNPRSSQMVSHPRTVLTQCYLSLVFEWELVLLLWLNSILVYSTWQGHYWLPISCKILQHFEIRGFMLNNDWGMNEENKVRKIGSPEILTGIWKHF